MREVALVVLLLCALLGTQLGAQLALRALSFDKLLGAAVLCIFLGLALGLPTAVVYHVQLARKLSARKMLDAGWLWHPTRLHGRLLPEERWSVLGWFYAGAAGWALTIGGCGLALWAMF